MTQAITAIWPGPRRDTEPRSSGAFTRWRVRRVNVLLVGILLLSAADLALTLGHLRTTGMAEANPVAAFIIRTTDSAGALAAFKMVSVAVCVTLLYWCRQRRSGEMAAWCGLAILAGMSIMWHAYSTSMESPEALRLAQASHLGEVGVAEGWLVLD